MYKYFKYMQKEKKGKGREEKPYMKIGFHKKNT
jgi:hypothetical protein